MTTAAAGSLADHDAGDGWDGPRWAAILRTPTLARGHDERA
jgi:hypothetical protein